MLTAGGGAIGSAPAPLLTVEAGAAGAASLPAAVICG
jgi:hypothetical protein